MKKTYIYTALIGILATSLALFFSFEDSMKMKKILSNYFYSKNRLEIQSIIDEKKEFLDAFAKYLSSAPEVKEGFLTNDRQKIINFVMPIYKELYPKFITEIHFFKPPAISFVNFANLKVYDVNLSNIREDILWVSTSFKPSTHFYVCRLYPGLRATYPVKYRGKVIGSISFGVSVEQLINFLKKSHKNVSFYVNDTLLKNFLNPKNYKKYEKYPLYNNYRVIGKVYKIDLSKPVQIKGTSLITTYNIKDFFGNSFGYFVIEDSISPIVSLIHRHFLHMIIVGIIATILALFVIFSIFNYFRQKYLQNSKIIDLIKEKKFDEIPKKTETKSIADYYKNDLIDLANEIKDYYEILNKKMAFYENKAYQDQLTGTLNRNFLEENAKKLLLKFKLAYNNTGVIMLDIDDFKKINDTYGHGTGDLALIEVAKTIKKLLRKEDLLIRYGGEEFVILLPNCDLEDTYLIAEKIRKEVEKIKIPLQNKKLSLTISLGITTIKDEDKTIFDSIKRADKALYKAKKSGKNKVAI